MKNPAFNCCIEPRRPQLDAPTREPEQRPCTDEFIANGGDYERHAGRGGGLMDKMTDSRAADAQAQGGGEVVAEVLQIKEGTAVVALFDDSLRVGDNLYTAPPSAPVGVRCDRPNVACAWPDCGRDCRHLTQQPAAVDGAMAIRVLDEWHLAMGWSTVNKHWTQKQTDAMRAALSAALATQPAAVDALLGNWEARARSEQKESVNKGWDKWVRENHAGAAHAFQTCAKQLRDALAAQQPAAVDEALSRDELDLCRQWFDSVQDTNGGYLSPPDYVLAAKLYRALGMRVPQSISRIAAQPGGAE